MRHFRLIYCAKMNGVLVQERDRGEWTEGESMSMDEWNPSCFGLNVTTAFTSCPSCVVLDEWLQ